MNVMKRVPKKRFIKMRLLDLVERPPQREFLILDVNGESLAASAVSCDENLCHSALLPMNGSRSRRERPHCSIAKQNSLDRIWQVDGPMLFLPCLHQSDQHTEPIALCGVRLSVHQTIDFLQRFSIVPAPVLLSQTTNPHKRHIIRTEPQNIRI